MYVPGECFASEMIHVELERVHRYMRTCVRACVRDRGTKAPHVDRGGTRKEKPSRRIARLPVACGFIGFFSSMTIVAAG